MDDLHKKFHVTAVTVRRAAEIEEASRKAVLALLLPEMKSGMTAPVASGVLTGWVQVASLDWERHEMAAELRRIADAIEAGA
jgi:hypothetical protein